MSQIVITTAKRYVDIDGLACVVAYQELIPNSLAVIPGPLNQSVIPSIRRWPLNYLSSTKGHDLEFIIMDVSEEKELPNFVKKDKVIKIFDHHFGFEKDWEHLGQNCHIEPIGACATLIWEEFVKSGKQSAISQVSANLLYTAIVSNTLNFQASITTERDKKAFADLQNFTDLPKEWLTQYFQEIELNAYLNPQEAIINDTKVQILEGMTCAIGQIELWNSESFIKEHTADIEAALKDFNTELWFLTSPSISEGRNYIYTKSETVKDFLRRVMYIDFFGGNIGVTDRLWLRKEILKKIQ